jgi:hypothetical protein
MTDDAAPRWEGRVAALTDHLLSRRDAAAAQARARDTLTVP